MCFRPDSDGRPQSEFGRIRTAIPNQRSAGFGRPSHICVQPDSDGRPQSEFGRIRTDGWVRSLGEIPNHIVDCMYQKFVCLSKDGSGTCSSDFEKGCLFVMPLS